MPPNPTTRSELFSFRSLAVLFGLSLSYIVLWVFTAKPLAMVSMIQPPVPISGNIVYFLLVRLLQKIWNDQTIALMAINGVLMLMVGWIVYRTGWGLADDRHRFQGATWAMSLFLLSPLSLVLPITLGFLGGYIVVPLFLLIFIGSMGMAEHWSGFMRAILLSLTWSLMLWVHLPTALLMLIAMIPWVLYSRRPVPSLGLFVTMILLGSAVFAAVWATGCAISGRWTMASGPVEAVRNLMLQIQATLPYIAQSGIRALGHRIFYIAGWLSPFLFIQGIWVTITTLQRMLRDRRSSTAELEGIVATEALLVVLLTPERNALPASWYILPLLALWVPLIAQQVAFKETFFSRGFRFTFGVGFVTAGIVLGLLYTSDLAGQVLPNPLALIKLLGAVLLAGVASYGFLKKHPLTLESRIQALLAGATLAYFVVMDFQLLR